MRRLWGATAWVLVFVSVAGAADELPVDEPERTALHAELQRLFGRTFTVHTTDHFIVFYDTDDAFARGRAALLERTHDEYYKSLAKKGLEPRPLTRRLVGLIFKEHEDYARYGEAADGGVGAYASGFYSTRTNRIAFHDDRTSPRFDDADRRLDEIGQRIAELRREAADLRRAGRSAAEQDKELARLRHEQRWVTNRMGVMAAGSNDAKATHEALHQLAFNSGLQDPRVEYPLWATEGMATNFESQGPDRRFGPHHDNPSRRALLIETHQRGGLMPLAQFAALLRLPDDVEQPRAAELYAQAWGLFRFLFIRHGPALKGYLESLTATGPGPRDAQALRKEFEAAFGPIPELERKFSQHLRSIR